MLEQKCKPLLLIAGNVNVGRVDFFFGRGIFEAAVELLCALQT